MPLYEYQCRACAYRFERIVKFSDAPLKTCPQCGKDAIEQMISAPAVQFKGSGWYVTDYARKSSAASSAAKSEGSVEAASAGKESGGAAKSVASEKTSGSSAAAPSGSPVSPSGSSAGGRSTAGESK